MAYNQAVLEAFKNEDVVINDLFSAMYPNKEDYLSEDMIHPNKEGVSLLGGMVADAIRSCGKYRNPQTKESQVTARDEKTVQ